MAGIKKNIAANEPKWEDIPEITKEEQPYPLPEGWKWVYLEYGYDITSSKRIHKADWRTEGIPFYRTRELVKLSDHRFVDNGLFIEEKLYNEIKELYGVPKINDILISGVGTIGIPWVVENENKFYFKDGNVIWLKSKNKILSKFIFYLFKSEFIKKSLKEMASGTTVDTYTIINAKKTKIPLPPPETQQRIVNRIESLFSKLDEAAEKVQAVIDSHEARKQAILHKAFSGELTKKWREENGVSLDSWEDVQLKEIIKVHSGQGLTSKQMVTEGKVPVYGGNGITGYHNKTNTKKGTIIIGRVGCYCGCIYMLKQDSWVTDNALIVKYDQERVFIDFLYYLLSYINLRKNDSSTAQPVISGSKIYSLTVTLPTLNEQEFIIKIIINLVNINDNIWKNATQIYEKLQQIKKNILNMAFVGFLR